MFEKLWWRLKGEGEGGDEAEGGGQSVAHDDRRVHQRHTISFETTCQVVNETTEAVRVRVRDVSRGGMKFLISRKLEPGMLVRIQLPMSGPEGAVLACVMHATAQSDGSYAIGCMFSDELGETEIEKFGGKKELAPASDKRVWQRFPTTGHVEYIELPPSGAAPKKAQITNISVTGIGLILEEKIEPGAMLDLVLKTSAGELAFDILACVVYIGARPEGGWVGGLHFIRQLEDDDLKRLS